MHVYMYVYACQCGCMRAYASMHVYTCTCVCLRTRLMPSLACRAGHGACVADVQFITESGNRDSQAQASCMCDPTYAGEMCQLPVMLADRPGALPTVACLNNCTESGVCVNGTCVCDAGRAGADCSEVSVQQMLDMPCPNSCTNNGVCANGTCACLIGWQGNDCSRLACPSDCSQHGVCQADATCLCDPGWGGAGCMTPLCPNGCTGQGACTSNGTCICYIGFEGDDCSILADCSKRGSRVCGFCSCNAGYYGDLCERDRCEDSRVYKDGDYDQPVSVCSGHGLCSDFGCVCEAGFSGRNCSLTANCNHGDSAAEQCSGHGTCSGGPGICGGVDNCPDQCTCDESHEIVYSGDRCAVPICPGPMMNGVINECSGKGHCGANLDTGLPKCTCVTANGAGSYKDFDCMTPPAYFVEDITPLVGPVEGNTHIVLKGAGLDRIISRNHFIEDWQNAKKYPSLMCRFDMADEDGNSWTLPLTPVVWRATVVKRFLPTAEEAADNHLTLHAGDSVTVYGCNPCDKTGSNAGARLIGEGADGVIGFLPADLYYYDSERDWDRVTCNSPPSNATGLATFTLEGTTLPTPPSLPIAGSDVDMASAPAYEYYNYEILQRLAPIRSPLRPVGGKRGPADINRATTITVTGSYFPRLGLFSCQFYDAISLDTQCKTKGEWVNKATLTCKVPMMRRARKLRLFVSSNSQQFEDDGLELVTYSVLSIEPVCIPTLGLARVRVNGDFLLPPEGQSPQITAYCRFGKVSSTLGSTSDDKMENWWAYHTVATPSALSYGSLECDAPKAGIYLATADFAVSLDACECGREGCPSCLVTWNVPSGGQNYFYGQWDSTMGDWHLATGLPTVEMRTVMVPELQKIFPTSGFMAGGTLVTLMGKNFSSTRCGWGMNQAPTCRFGNIVTPQVAFIDMDTVVCTTPPLQTGVDSEVLVSIAIDGQSYVDGPNFMYIKAYGVNKVLPSTGSVAGGSRVIITGPGVQELASPAMVKYGPYRNTDSISCVFVLASGRRLITSAVFMNPKQAYCATPSDPPPDFEQSAKVYLSPNHRAEDSQMSLTFAPFRFYAPPVLIAVLDPIGSIHGGNVVDIQGTFFLDLDTIACKFGNTIVPATFISNQRMQCTVPPVQEPAAVPCRISLNGQDFSQKAVTYHYFDIDYIFPNQGPARGGSRLVVQTIFQGNFTLANQMCQLPYPAKSTGPDFINREQCLSLNGNWLTVTFKLGFGTSKVSVAGFAGPLKNQIFFDVPSPIVDPDGNTITQPARYKLYLTIGTQINRAFLFPEHTMTFYDLTVPCGPPASPRTCNAWPLPFIKLTPGGAGKTTVDVTTTRPVHGVNVTCKMVSCLVNVNVYSVGDYLHDGSLALI